MRRRTAARSWWNNWASAGALALSLILALLAIDTLLWGRGGGREPAGLSADRLSLAAYTSLPSPLAPRAAYASTPPLGSSAAPAGSYVPLTTPAGPAAPQAASAPPPATPTTIRIPAIGVYSPVIRLGLMPDHTLQVPGNYRLAGWYTGSAVPGTPGPAVIVGHVTSVAGPAVFYRLRFLRPGDVVWVHESSGARFRYIVERSIEVPKSAFPTQEVYGATRGPTLRLITWGGRFNYATGHYVDNIVVFARLG